MKTRPSTTVVSAWRRCLLMTMLLALLLVALPHSAPLFHRWFPPLSHPLYQRSSFLALTLAHTTLVALASGLAVTIGLTLGIMATRPAARELLPTVQALAVIGQTFPPVAVLAIAVPLLGYGGKPTVLALTLYGILPVLGQTVAGLGQVPAQICEAADGMGYSRWRRLREVELPLALAPIMTGIRLSVIISVGTAAIGSTVGATSLGSPIIEGLVGNNTAYVIQGAVLVGALALWIDALLGLLQAYLQPRRAPKIRPTKPHRHARPASALLIGGLAMTSPWSPSQAMAPSPPWHIESFCRRPAIAAQRCLIRARQGIIIFTLAELPQTPAVRWLGSNAVLISQTRDGTQWRFYRPPQQISGPLQHVVAIDEKQPRIAYRQAQRLVVAAMFAPAQPLATLPLPIHTTALQASFETHALRLHWLDSRGQNIERSLPLPADQTSSGKLP